jgi:hypothetical protein
MRRALLALGLLLLAGGGYLAWKLHDRPALNGFPVLAARAPSGPAVTVRFLGVTSLAISDGTTTLVTDGFFTRPGLLRTVAGTIGPDPQAIDRALARAQLEHAAAVFTVHSH